MNKDRLRMDLVDRRSETRTEEDCARVDASTRTASSASTVAASSTAEPPLDPGRVHIERPAPNFLGDEHSTLRTPPIPRETVLDEQSTGDINALRISLTAVLGLPPSFSRNRRNSAPAITSPDRLAGTETAVEKRVRFASTE